MTLRFDQAANDWLQAFPIGNGRLDAMGFWRRDTGTSTIVRGKSLGWCSGKR
ncbi:hypothetical protein [Peribacillus glennii]|uniref:hypothetical protein n=1 Tax=Peribacillus glennii TaxID=2303991 RepID=UPI001314F6F3|nr:hypothetical protein [Peribacillus glennii]